MIFVDTGAWIAVTDTSDQYHRQAVEMYSLLKKQRKRFVTTEFSTPSRLTNISRSWEFLFAPFHKLTFN